MLQTLINLSKLDNVKHLECTFDSSSEDQTELILRVIPKDHSMLKKEELNNLAVIMSQPLVIRGTNQGIENKLNDISHDYMSVITSLDSSVNQCLENFKKKAQSAAKKATASSAKTAIGKKTATKANQPPKKEPDLLDSSDNSSEPKENENSEGKNTQTEEAAQSLKIDSLNTTQEVSVSQPEETENTKKNEEEATNILSGFNFSA